MGDIFDRTIPPELIMFGIIPVLNTVYPLTDDHN